MDLENQDQVLKNILTNKPKQFVGKNKDGLKPCPFCARKDVKLQIFHDSVFSVFCKCGLESPKDSFSKVDAKRIWNRRRLNG